MCIRNIQKGKYCLFISYPIFIISSNMIFIFSLKMFAVHHVLRYVTLCMHEYFYLRVRFYLNITKEILPVQMGKICAQSTPIKS